MGFAKETGYLPLTIEDIMTSIMAQINIQFATSYTYNNFVSTNFYKYFYALAQKLQENEVKTSEIFLKMQDYFNETNEKVLRPNTTAPGILDLLLESGWLASVKAPLDADAGKAFVCVDAHSGTHAIGNITITNFANLVSGTDDSVGVGGVTFTAQATAATLTDPTFQAATSNEATATSLAAQINAHATTAPLVKARAFGAYVLITAIDGGVAGNSIALAYTDNDTNVGATKSGTVLDGGVDAEDYETERLQICTIIKNSIVAGVISQGTEVETITLDNSQSFDFKFNLPYKIPVLLKLTLTLSDNNLFTVSTPDVIRQTLFDNVNAKYKLGKNFEPQRYFSILDAPWAAMVLLEYSQDDGATYTDDIFVSAYDEILTFEIEDIEIVEV